jgi:hypothetical protein
MCADHADQLELPRGHGPAGPAFCRFGRMTARTGRTSDAIGDPRRAKAAQHQATQEAAEREAQRAVCADCGQ